MSNNEGVVRTYQHHDNQLAGLIEVSCKTVAVAKHCEFLRFVDDLLLQVVNNNPMSVDALLEQKWLLDTSQSVSECLARQSEKFGEEIKIKSFLRWSLEFKTEDM